MTDFRIRTRNEAIPVLLNGGAYKHYAEISDEEIRDIVTPNFFSRIRKGEIINNPMIQVKNLELRPIYTVDCYYYNYGVQHLVLDTCTWPSFLTLPSVDAEEIEDAQDLAVTLAHSGVGADQLDLLASIGELRESVATIANVGIKAYKVFRALRKFNLRAIKKSFSKKNIEEQYLEYRYGLRPLYYELKQVHDYLKNEACHNRQTSRGYSEVLHSEQVSTYSMGGNFLPWATSPDAVKNFIFTTTAKTTCRAGVLYSFQFNDTLSKVLAELGVDRPISSVWELVPFSFMIDWFVKVGDTIRAWEPKPHCSDLASWCVTTTELRNEIYLESVVNFELGSYTVISAELLSNPTAVKTQVTKKRSVNPSLSIFPSLDINLSTSKILDMVAIFDRLRDSRRRQMW